MNVIWNLVVFMFCINLAAGIVTTGLGIGDSPIEHNSQFDSDANVFNVNTNTTESPISTPNVEQSNLFDWVSSFLNLITFGFLNDVIGFFINYLFGFGKIIKALIPIMPDYMLYAINTLTAAGYTFALISILSGKKMDSESD